MPALADPDRPSSAPVPTVPSSNLVPVPATPALDAAEAQSPASGYRVRNSTADRALDILLLFAEDRLVLSATEVAEHLGVARSTAYRYLQSLTSMNFLEENAGETGFRLGTRVLELARLASIGMGLADLARPIIKELARSVGHSALLTRRMGDSVVCLEREEAQTSIRISYERGQVLPINAGASALVLLAFAPEAEIDEIAGRPLPRFTEATITDPVVLKTRLAQIRAEGIAVTRGELDPDVLGVGAPVFGAQGDAVAAVSVVALAHRVPAEEVQRLTEAVREAAAELTRQVKLVAG